VGEASPSLSYADLLICGAWSYVQFGEDEANEVNAVEVWHL